VQRRPRWSHHGNLALSSERQVEKGECIVSPFILHSPPPTIKNEVSFHLWSSKSADRRGTHRISSSWACNDCTSGRCLKRMIYVMVKLPPTQIQRIPAHDCASRKSDWKFTFPFSSMSRACNTFRETISRQLDAACVSWEKWLLVDCVRSKSWTASLSIFPYSTRDRRCAWRVVVEWRGE
jgi:hypothetical protein